MASAFSLVNLCRSTILVLGVVLTPAASFAADKLTVLTSWFAQAEHGGFYQAKATGLYAKEGLDVTIKMGGPQVNGMQLLLAGETDVISGYDFQTLSAVQQGLPLIAIATQFQHDLQGFVTHPDVTKLEDIKSKTILISTSSRTSYWPWLKAKYGLSDDQTRPYTFNPQPFLADPNAVQQGYPSSEPFGLIQQKIPYKFFLFADEGYPPYGSALMTRQDTLRDRADVLRRFVRATMQGWVSYLDNPAPGNVLIKEDNSKMPDELLAFGVSELKRINVLGAGDAATKGVGIITEARWKANYDYMVSAGLLKPETDWHKAFTTSIIEGINVMPK